MIVYIIFINSPHIFFFRFVCVGGSDADLELHGKLPVEEVQKPILLMYFEVVYLF
jgi:hypothetical protein